MKSTTVCQKEKSSLFPGSHFVLLALLLLLPVCVTACGTGGDPSVMGSVEDTAPDSSAGEEASASGDSESALPDESETPAVSEEPPETDVQSDTVSDAETEPPLPRTFTDAPDGYFSDALFIGDSRTVGLAEYAPLEGADYFATVGMSVYTVLSTKTTVGDHGKTDLDTLLSTVSYGKIYLMLGINELGYGRKSTVERYGALVGHIRELQPDAVIFIEANLHVTAVRSAEDEYINNREIDDFNTKISAFADSIDTFYIDINELFDDYYGNLRSEYTFDDAHLRAEQYIRWSEWLKSKAILK